MKRILLAGLLIVFCLGPGRVSATELVYTPVSPSFGGNPLNGTFLLGMAQAQNKFKEDTTKDPIETFEENLMRRVLSNIAYKIVDDAFGVGGEDMAGGHYEFGDYVIDVSNDTGENLTVTISDTLKGGQTTIEVPVNY